MRRILFGLFLFLQTIALSAQKMEQGFDFFFKPTTDAPRYYVITEKQDSVWHRQAWYLPEKNQAMEGWYKDKDCKIPHGTVSWYHTTRFLKSTTTYKNGEKEGACLEYDEEGRIVDSANYVAGRLKGIRLHWRADGMLADSMQFDGAGNGVEMNWDKEGNVSSAGYWVSDTIKRGRWKYFHPNGKIMATEDYVDGKRIACNCFNEAGQALDSNACTEREADFPGGLTAWRKFIERNLRPDVPVRNKAPEGKYTVVMQFVVDTEGKVTGVRPKTSFGYGMEEEAERILNRSPRWNPALQFGRKVKAYRLQPITFVIFSR